MLIISRDRFSMRLKAADTLATQLNKFEADIEVKTKPPTEKGEVDSTVGHSAMQTDETFSRAAPTMTRSPAMPRWDAVV
jgi:signal recognition particle GTPase